MNGKHRQNPPAKSTSTKPAQDTSKGKTEKSNCLPNHIYNPPIRTFEPLFLKKST